jgi:hypothetical protein
MIINEITQADAACSLFSFWRMGYGYNKYIGWLLVFAFHLFFSKEFLIFLHFFSKNSFFIACKEMTSLIEDLFTRNLKTIITLILVYHSLKYTSF